MIFFKNNQENFKPSFFIAFLCGVTYKRDSIEDKRNVLYDFLKQNRKIKPVILEKSFSIESFDNTDTLRYKEIGLNNLRDIEVLTSLYSHLIFIIHESMATASEMGMFSYNDHTAEKICVIYPDEFSINKNVISIFFKYAFFNDKNLIINDKLPFYPRTKTVYHADNNIEAYTYFRNNQITSDLKKKINTFIENKSKCTYNLKFDNEFSKDHSYFLRKNKKRDNGYKITMNLTAEFFFYHMLAILNTNEVKIIFQKNNDFKDCVHEIGTLFLEALKRTIIYKYDDIIIKDNDFTCYVNGYGFEQALFYLFYIFHAIGIVEIKDNTITRVENKEFEGKIRKLCKLLISYKEEWKLEKLCVSNNAYKQFYIKKGNGFYRKITTYSNNEEGYKLKEYHEKINDFLNENIAFSIFTKAYLKETSIVKNARCHLYNNTFIQIDIKDFFSSINHHKLLNRLYFELKNGNNIRYIVSKQDCLDILKTCYCSSKGLPIGSVLSPTLANIYMKSFDNSLYGKLKKLKLKNIIYTRYADDMVISCKDKLDQETILKIKELVSKQLNYLGLKINEKKFRHVSLYTSNHVKITGINICKGRMEENNNYRYLTVGRSKRELLYKLFFEVLELNDKEGFLYQYKLEKLKGYYAYIYSVEKENIEKLCPPKYKTKLREYGYDSFEELIKKLRDNNIQGEL